MAPSAEGRSAAEVHETFHSVWWQQCRWRGQFYWWQTMRFFAWWLTSRQRKKRDRHGGSVCRRPKDRATDQTPARGTTPRRGKGFSSSLPREDRFWTRPSLLCNHYQELSTRIMRMEWQTGHHLSVSASHAFPHIRRLPSWGCSWVMGQHNLCIPLLAHNFMELQRISVHSWFGNKNTPYT